MAKIERLMRRHEEVTRRPTLSSRHTRRGTDGRQSLSMLRKEKSGL